MSICVVFNAVIAHIEGREDEAVAMLRPMLGEKLSNFSDIQSLFARLDEAVKYRLVSEAHDMLRTLLREEMARPFPPNITTIHELAMVCRGRNDALAIFEEKWEDLQNQLKSPREYEPVDNPI